MIEKETGAIIFRSLRLEPSTTRKDFLASVPEENVEPLVDNPPYRSCSTRSVDRNGNPFALSVYFRDERLTMVHIAAIDDRFGTSWDDWSREKELERKAYHTRWLREECGIGERENFAWGEVASAFDEKGGSSSIVVQYTGN